MPMIDIQQMSHEEKLKVMHALWEDLARDEDALESPAWHGEVVRETEERARSGAEQALAAAGVSAPDAGKRAWPRAEPYHAMDPRFRRGFERV